MPEATSAAIDEAVLVDQARAVQGNVALLVAGNVVMAAIAGWALWGVAPAVPLAIWLALQWAQSGYGAWLALRARRRPITERNAARRLRQITRGMPLNSVLWAIGIVAFWPAERPELVMLLLLVGSGSITSVMHAGVAWLPLVRAYMLPILLAVILAAVRAGGMLNVLIALAAAIHAMASLRLSGQMHRTVIQALRSRHEIARLAADLEAQRDRAEAASEAKSRFLAAASHDLRQPVHALTLMLGAWRAQPEGPEAERMRERVEATVGAMGNLFNALLDMSRLDAGLVTAEPRPVEAAPLLARLASQFAVQAAERGLALRSSVRALALHTDPVLLERVLSNLLSNAVRYTGRGGVLLTARARGPYAVLRIVDSGPGIPPEQHEAVFQEFVQLHNPERDRHKGLGLGLAIVRRLCELLAIELTMRSRLGRGTAFTLRLPLAQAVPRAVAGPASPAAAASPASERVEAASSAAASTSAMSGSLIVVIDDDADIRAGMRALLASWGHAVIAAGSLAELRPALLPLAQAPALVISDYRLRGGENGLHVVQQLREEFNDEELPALLITGDTAPARLSEAGASGLRVLHKPVEPALLRAAVEALGAPAVSR